MVDNILTIIKEEYIVIGSLNDTLLVNYFIKSMNSIIIQEEREEKLKKLLDVNDSNK